MNAIISVIIPIYKVEKYLQRCVDSVLAQTFTDFEAILVDDGTPDFAGGLADEYALFDQRVIVIHKVNGGSASSRNKAMDIAQSEYLGFVDSDDFIDNTMYSKLIAAAKSSNQRNIVMCGRKLVNEQEKYMTDFFSFTEQQIWNQKEAIHRFLLWDGLDGASWDKIFQRKVINDLRFPIEYVSEDIPFVFRALEKSDNVINIGEPLYYYRQRDNSLSHSQVFTNKSRGIVKYSKEIFEHVKESEKTFFYEAQYFYLHLALYYHHLLMKNNIFGKEYKTNRKNIVKAKKYLNNNPYFVHYEKKELLLISKFYYPLYRFLKDRNLLGFKKVARWFK